MQTEPKKTYTFEDVLAEKAEVLTQLREQHALIRQKTTSLFRSPASTPLTGGSVFRLLGSMDKLMMIYTGVTTGFKVVRQIRRLFGRKKRW